MGHFCLLTQFFYLPFIFSSLILISSLSLSFPHSLSFIFFFSLSLPLSLIHILIPPKAPFSSPPISLQTIIFSGIFHYLMYRNNWRKEVIFHKWLSSINGKNKIVILSFVYEHIHVLKNYCIVFTKLLIIVIVNFGEYDWEQEDS